nr:immunoglobulin light chain junction region [Macaca mulatta]MOW16958.1 immunoglobulin light chain junction region [Macaca mulatta]MOW18357.1 immunoglobulin light chain junction region [Macaca mulatta]
DYYCSSYRSGVTFFF